MFEHNLETDVLVVGGGVAGLNAALSARALGARVIIIEKAVIERSGHTAGGIDHFLAYLETGPQWDTAEAYLDFTITASRGATRIEVVEDSYCGNLKAAIQRFREIGVPLNRPDGTYFRTRSFGQPGEWWINFNGKRLKPTLARAARRAGCRVLDRVALVDLLRGADQITGAVGFHIRTGELYVVSAKAVVLATGGTNRLFQHPSGLSFNTWMCPADTGDGEAAAFRAGAALANIEYLRLTVVPRGFSAPGLNALVGMGAKLINGKGEEFMEKYHPMGMKGPRYKLAEAVIAEYKAHRGPVYMDCTALAPEALEHLVQTLSLDKDTFGDFLGQRGIDLKRDYLEVAPSEGMQGGPNEVCGAGIHINRDCRSTLAGLYGAGNASDQNRSLHMAVTSGMHAGTRAAQWSMRIKTTPLREPGQLNEARRLLKGPMKSKRKGSWREVESVLQRIITEGLGPARTAWGFRLASERLTRLEGWMGEVHCPTYHDLCRFMELRNIVTIARCMLAAAEERRESRFGLCHNRLDYPERDDRQWLGQILVTRGRETLTRTRFIPITYSVPGGEA